MRKFFKLVKKINSPADENMEEWKVGPKIIDETVRVTKEFLEQHPEIPVVSGKSKWSKEAYRLSAPAPGIYHLGGT